MTLKEITPVLFAFQFMKRKVRDVFIKWKQALFLRRLAHKEVVSHEQIVLLGQPGEWCFAKGFCRHEHPGNLAVESRECARAAGLARRRSRMSDERVLAHPGVNTVPRLNC
jgi:hypothetical protein